MPEQSQARAFIDKIQKDNVTMLASVVSWGVLSSVIPILVAIVAVSSLVLRDTARQRVLIQKLSQLLQHSLTQGDLRLLVHVAVRHTGLLSILGIVGIAWGASNVGGAVSTVFQPIFQVRGRPILREKVIDIAMILVFTVLMLVTITATTGGALLDRALSSAPVPAATSFAIGTVISLLAGLLLFSALYSVFPNVEPRFKRGHVWKGAVVAALLFQVLSYVWPLYAVLFHPQRYGALFAPIVVLGVWIYFFSLILVLGAEIVAFGCLSEAGRAGEAVGPAPDGTVPQRITNIPHAAGE
jgi:YihY family inner membrane protein